MYSEPGLPGRTQETGTETSPSNFSATPEPSIVILAIFREILPPMDVAAMNNALIDIIKSRQELAAIDYNNPKYDELEEKLHDLEDDFIEKYGDDLEKALQEVHDEYCPDSDVLVPIAYIAKKYQVSARDEYSVAPSEGVFVEMDNYPGKDTKLVMLPSPPRILLNIGSEKQQVVWVAK